MSFICRSVRDIAIFFWFSFSFCKLLYCVGWFFVRTHEKKKKKKFFIHTYSSTPDVSDMPFIPL